MTHGSGGVVVGGLEVVGAVKVGQITVEHVCKGKKTPLLAMHDVERIA